MRLPLLLGCLLAVWCPSQVVSAGTKAGKPRYGPLRQFPGLVPVQKQRFQQTASKHKAGTKAGGDWWVDSLPWWAPVPPEWGKLPITMYTQYYHGMPKLGLSVTPDQSLPVRHVEDMERPLGDGSPFGHQDAADAADGDAGGDADGGGDGGDGG